MKSQTAHPLPQPLINLSKCLLKNTTNTRRIKYFILFFSANWHLIDVFPEAKSFRKVLLNIFAFVSQGLKAL